MTTCRRLKRREFLRGVLSGAGAIVGLPLFDCFLNGNGTALANGAPLPVRFGSWLWGLGMNEKIWIPDKLGANYDLKPELSALGPLKQHVNVFSRYRVDLGGASDLVHYSGWAALRCGQVPSGNELPRESIDVTIADAIGGGTRFPSLQVTASGSRGLSPSFRGPGASNPTEISPIELYRRVFGSEFQDPNAPTFTPNAETMLRKSVLSSVREESASLRQYLGSADRQRLDAYFTSLRGIENRLALQLEKPPPAPSCRIPEAPPPEIPSGTDVELIDERHTLMTDILVMALACNQTRVFNIVYSDPAASTTKRGEPNTHHIVTHEENMNKQGYQEMHSWFVRRAMTALAYLIARLAAVREGDGTLLDSTLIYAHSEHDNARIHSIRGIPMMTAGRAGGRIRSGLHVDGKHESLASDLGLTLLRAVGLETDAWGVGAMRTTKTINEILV